MAKHVIIEAYSFGNTTNTVNVTGKNLRPEQLNVEQFIALTQKIEADGI